MVFDSYTFVPFLIVVLVLHRLMPTWRAQKVVLLAGSYLFYAAWNPPFVLLLLFTTVFDWFVAQGLVRLTDQRHRKALLILSLVQALGLLAFFKYSGFLVDSLAAAVAAAGGHVTFAAPDVVLPVGISFYTFHTLSFTIDVYRRVLKPGRSFLDYALYVTFFPSLVAGPIVRASEFLPQLEEPKKASSAQFGWGLTLLVAGLCAKVALADALLAPVADSVYGEGVVADTVSAWVGTLAFAGQIFFDFAGYSACALGVALLFGFTLSPNFHFPYAAIGFSDFWRRWHISLSSWLRDYLYVSLGGNRRGRWRTDVNLLLTMLIGGLWHGASWTFVAWGAVHGFYLVVEKQLVSLFGGQSWTTRPAVRFALAGLTFVLVCITWVFFRAHTFSQAFDILTAMFGRAPAAASSLVDVTARGITVVVVFGLVLSHWLLRNTTLESVAARTPVPLRALIIALMLVCIATASGEDRAFIYFQF